MMVCSGRQTTLCILLLLTLVITARPQTAASKTATSTISGKVTVGDKGLHGVVVALAITDQYRSNIRPTRFRATTDEEGTYRITNVLPGTYDVVLASPVYIATEGRKSLIVSANETVENIDIALERGGVITGKVTDPDGRPVIEEAVYVSPVRTTHRVPYFRNIRTDDRGIYRAYGIPAGTYSVSAGRDPSSSPVNRGPEGGYQRTYHPSTVDPAAAILIKVTEGSETTNVDITLGGPVRTYSARGRIIDSDTDKPMPKTKIGLAMSVPYGTTAMGGVAESDKDGEFKLENLAPGKYAVYSHPPEDSGWHSEAVNFEVTDRDVEGLVIKTSRGASVSGVVILEGTDDTKVRAKLLAGRIIGQIIDGFIGQSHPSATINPNGSFRITGLAPGRLWLELEARNTFRVIRLERDGMVNPRGVEIKDREQVTGLRVVVGYANGAIRGAIKLPSDLQLPANARLRVAVRRTEDVIWAQGPPFDADARGHFSVEGLIPGTYEVVVTVLSSPRGQPTVIPPTKQTVLVTNGAVTDVTLTLQKPAPQP